MWDLHINEFGRFLNSLIPMSSPIIPLSDMEMGLRSLDFMPSRHKGGSGIRGYLLLCCYQVQE